MFVRTLEKVTNGMTPVQENLERIKFLENYIKKMHEHHSPEECQGSLCFLEQILAARIERARQDGLRPN